METSNETTKTLNFEEINEKFNELQEKMINRFNGALDNFALKLDKTADKMHKTAEFFREKDADALKQDCMSAAKKHPAQTLGAVFVFGLLVGKILSR